MCKGAGCSFFAGGFLTASNLEAGNQSLRAAKTAKTCTRRQLHQGFGLGKQVPAVTWPSQNIFAFHAVRNVGPRYGSSEKLFRELPTCGTPGSRKVMDNGVPNYEHQCPCDCLPPVPLQ